MYTSPLSLVSDDFRNARFTKSAQFDALIGAKQLHYLVYTSQQMVGVDRLDRCWNQVSALAAMLGYRIMYDTWP